MLYHIAMATTFKISSNGQVSLPVAVRRRWQVDEVVVVDQGDRVVVRPCPSAACLRGKWKGKLPPTSAMRAEERSVGRG
jgi:bifunctional DNA-binding transcriptional regulator/antitoxin component of YhaV-PrlF toxin-antitoxin module